MTTTAASSPPPLFATSHKRSFTDFKRDSPPQFHPRPASAASIPSILTGLPHVDEHNIRARLQTPPTHPHSYDRSPLSAPPSRPGSPSRLRIAGTRHLERSPHFSSNASIVLIGVPGAGVSSLAVIAAKALQRKIVESHDYFVKLSGCSRNEFRKRYGSARYAQQETHVMSKLFAEHGTNTVIAYGPISSREDGGSQILKEFARTHPVVYVSRHPGSIARYLGVDKDRIRQLIRAAGPLYRASSNVEFHNFSESTVSSVSGPSTPRMQQNSSRNNTPYLVLKDLEQDLLRMLEHIFDGRVVLSNIVSSFPLASRAIEARAYTHSLVLPLSVLEKEDFAIEEVDAGVDALELVVNAPLGQDGSLSHTPDIVDSICKQFARLRRATVLPIIYSVECSNLIGTIGYRPPEPKMLESYLELIHLGARLCADYLAVNPALDERAFESVITSKGLSRVIGSHHASKGWAEGSWSGKTVEDFALRACRMGCDALRLSQPARVRSDNLAVANFARRLREIPRFDNRIPVCAYNTGIPGRMSHSFNSFLTPVTHERLPQSLPGTPFETSQLITVKEAHRALFSSFVLDRLDFFVIGKNVSHSLSPAMHNAAYSSMGLPHQYSICEITSLRDLSIMIADDNFGGASVALPFKVEIIATLDKLDENAEAIGAVNTLVPIRHDTETDTSHAQVHNRCGKVIGLKGINTDWIGIKSTISSGLSPVNAVVASTVALIMGAGGMARAAVLALIRLGVKTIFIWNRTQENAIRVARHFQGRNLVDFAQDGGSASATTIDGSHKPVLHVLTSLDQEWPTHLALPPTIIIAAMAASGSNDAVLAPPNVTLPPSWLASSTGGVLLELAYRPVITPLLHQARKPEFAARGWLTKDMLDMLPEQAFAQFEVFIGKRAPRKVMRQALLEEFRQKWEPHMVAYDDGRGV